ncbi:MAG: response regulator, partial [Chitinophagaceae bacterium]|nr:response regulator [Anaerolineae bacterium]
LLKMEESSAAIPILITATSQALPSEMAAYLASRSIRVIPKPVDVKQFTATARQLINRHSDILLVPTKRLPILIVEDSHEVSSGFMMILEMEGYLVMTVPNGQLALDAVKNRQHSLIFLDMQMPVMDGLGFMTAYAEMPAPHTPVIIFSAQRDLPIETFPYFVIGRLPKPFQAKEMLIFVSKYANPV